MKQSLLIPFLLLFFAGKGQEVLHLKNGSTVTVQNGVELTLQGGLTLENGSLLVNNGATRLLNNNIANQSNWSDNSISGALGGNGLVIFNSNHLHQYYGPTHFYNVQMNAAGLSLNNNFRVENSLNLVNGTINTNVNYAYLMNATASSLVNDVSNTGYSNSWINGYLRRSIISNTSAYDFPVGDATKSNLLQLINNNILGTTYLTASFGPKPGTDVGMFLAENNYNYTAVNNGGVWYLVPDAQPSGGNYALQLYFNGFTGLTDNRFAMIRRPDGSTNAADWTVPPGSLLEPENGNGRLVNDGFARRYNISNFSQWGIGMFDLIPPCEGCTVYCTYTQGFYGNVNGTACYSANGTTTNISSSQLMLNAFGNTTYKVFGSTTNRQFFTLYKTDISNGYIFKMLPGQGNSQAISVDAKKPYNGAYYSDPTTWYLVPLEPSGAQKGRIDNLLLSQAISLWFNLRTSSSLGSLSLVNDTLLTRAQTTCGSGIGTGPLYKFGLPHSIIVYLNSGFGYTNDVNGLFHLANDVLGGVNNAVTAADIQTAVSAINVAFDGCRILIGTLPYIPATITTKVNNQKPAETVVTALAVQAYPNPYSKDFHLEIKTPESGEAMIEFFDVRGAKLYQLSKYLHANEINVVPYIGTLHPGPIFYRVSIGLKKKAGIILHMN
jgi:hypothetical protein